MRVGLALMMLCCAGAAQAASCTYGKAVYTPVEDEGVQTFEARFVPRKIDVQLPFVMRMSDVKSKIARDFSFAYPNGAGGYNMFVLGKADAKPPKKPPQVASIIYFNDKLGLALPPSTMDDEAAAYFLTPGMMSYFHYVHQKDSFMPPDGMWKRTGCDP